jgi:DNA mismatch endonuclease (patch repair protein)
MADVFTPEKRSEIMSRIRSRSGLDRRVHAWLSRAGIRHRMWPRIVGNPDVALRGGTFVFLDSCFFHRCPLHYREPKSNRAYWRGHIRRNVERDRLRALLPYRWIRIWEHDVRGGRFREILLEAAGGG